MTILTNLWEKIFSLNDPYLVRNFQNLCQIEISYIDNGFSTAGSESTELSSSDDDTGAGGKGLSRNGHARSQGSKNQCLSRTNGGITQQRTSPREGDKSFRSLAFDSSDNYLFEQSMENNVSFKIRNRFLYYLFSFGSSLGNETFYCLFYSFWFWNIDSYVCRRVVLIWAMTMYIGQAAKDIIRWPRPGSPPVAKLEKKYELEYGMPSTHAMIGFAIPFSFLILTAERYIVSKNPNYKSITQNFDSSPLFSVFVAFDGRCVYLMVFAGLLQSVLPWNA